jgi:putative ABC transport system ATP-binding protein
VGINLTVHEGELLTILGSSGSGKTTLLNMMGGMDRPDYGRVLFEGRDIHAGGDRGMTRYRRDEVGFIFQSFNLIGELTALENVRLTADNAAQPHIAEEALALVGLQDRIDSYPSQLSGGQQQRVSIARALAKRSRLLLCDEPTGALDHETGQQILVILEEIARRMGKTVVIVTHTQEVARMADRIVWMRDGRIVKEKRNIAPVSAHSISW